VFDEELKKPMTSSKEFPHQPTIGHIVPASLGGSNNLKNLRWECYSCNQQKGSTPPERDAQGRYVEGHVNSSEVRKKMSESRQGNKNPNFGKKKNHTTCMVVECLKEAKKKGMCDFHYRRQLRGIPLDRDFYALDYYRRGKLEFEHKDIRSWSRSTKKYFGDKCMICGWNETGCVCHHIVPRKLGGRNTLSNVAVLCPNHHKLADENKIDKALLQNLNQQALEAKGDKD
jgi:5-methylcytosine-specific restriction endonuclease McrA